MGHYKLIKFLLLKKSILKIKEGYYPSGNNLRLNRDFIIFLLYCVKLIKLNSGLIRTYRLKEGEEGSNGIIGLRARFGKIISAEIQFGYLVCG